MSLEFLKDDLIRDEGFKESAYQDSEGYWTIGIGRLIDERRGGKITSDEAKYLLANDIMTALRELDRNIPWWRSAPDNVQRGLANMAFNLGWPRLRGFKRMLAALKARDYQKTADEALDSKWATQVGPRAERIARLFREHDPKEPY